MGLFSKKEKKSFFAGVSVGKKMASGMSNVKAHTTSKSSRTNNSAKEVKFSKDFLAQCEVYRKKGLGAISYKGRIYDTNFKGKPVEITKDELKQMRLEYVGAGERNVSDMEVADRFVKHMRRKYGTFDKNDNFIGLLGDK